MLKFSIKNIFRYKSRSILTLLVILVSGFGTVLIAGLMDGMVDFMLDGFVKYQTGHIRITTDEYLLKERFMPVYENIENVQALQQELLTDERIKMAVPTIHFGGFISKGDTTIPIGIIALPLKENAFGLDTKIIEGGTKDTGVLIGTTLMDRLSLNVGDSPMLVSTTVDDAINATKIPIVGKTSFGISMFDKSNVFIDIESAQKLLRSYDATTEIFIILNDESRTDDMVTVLKEKYPSYAIESYKTQLGAMYMTIQMEKNVLIFIAVIIMFLGSLVIVNSLIASIYERMSEIGMLKALGYGNKELIKMLFYEGCFFGLVGGGSGFTLGYLFLLHVSKVGINYGSMMDMVNLPIDSTLYPSLNGVTIVACAFITILVPALVSLIPARTISKISPVDAINSRN